MEKNHHPPKWADKLLAWWCAPAWVDEIQGDLHEAFHRRDAAHNLQYAKFMFIADVLRSLSFHKSRYASSTSKPTTYMVRNYITIGYRNLRRSKLFTAVNVLGLALGIAACLLIMQYVLFEVSYDTSHANSGQIYRVTTQVRPGGKDVSWSATSHPGTGPAMKAEFPEVKDYARLVHQSIFAGDVMNWSYETPEGEKRVFNEEHVFDVDGSVLTMFSFPLVYGDPATALNDVSSVVISESVARKYFGDENPMGKTMIANGWSNFKVTGVFKDIPENSHLKFDMLTSWFMDNGWQGTWDHNNDFRWCEFFTYVRLDERADAAAVQAKLPTFVERHVGERMKQLNSPEAFMLQPLEDIHLRSPAMTREQEPHGSELTVYFLVIIASLILVIAWINYVNLSTCKSMERAREVGIRKVAGATKSQLVFQFLFESAVVNLVAIVLAVVIVVLALPYFNSLTGKDISSVLTGTGYILRPSLWLVLVAMFLLGTFGAGVYPAVALSSFRVVTVLKGKFFGSASGITLRKALVGLQFTISVALIAGTVIVFRQVSYMRNLEPSYTKDELLVIKGPLVGDSTFGNRFRAFKAEVKGHTAVKSMAPTSEIPGKLISQLNYIRQLGRGTEQNVSAYHFYVDEEFANTYGLEVVAGRSFREGENMPRSFDADKGVSIPIMLNERAVELLGFKSPEDALNQLTTFGWGAPEWKGEIVGVLENHHQRSLHEPFTPILYLPATGSSGQFYTVNMGMRNASETIAFLKERYENAFPGNQFDYFFLDDYVAQQYTADQQFGKVFGLFTGLALVVATLGLFGLSTFMIMQRTKEIAIRKVLGATIAGMVQLFSRDFVKLIVVANVIALPVVYILVERWLNSFAFRIKTEWLIFLIPVVILLFISLLTVTFQTFRTASANPMRSLRDN